jgi:sugar lactone lactonase YvrE
MNVALQSVGFHGTGLRRPECVLATADGNLFVSHLGSGIVRIAPSGQLNVIGSIDTIEGTPWIPNGFALLEDRSFLVANMGEAGGVWRLTETGEFAPFLREADGRSLTATNFVLLDHDARIWITVSTRRWPIGGAFTFENDAPVSDGYIVLVDAKGPRIVADNLAFANEIRIDARGEYLYVAETFGRRISRFKIQSDGSLTKREIFRDFGFGIFPDGIAFDAEGYLWVASLISNQILRLAPSGADEIIVEEPNPAHVDNLERKMRDSTINRSDMQASPATILKNTSSVCFGGEDLRTIYVGSLGGDTLPSFHTPVAGLKPPHWNFG